MLSASAQYVYGMEAWVRSDRTVSFRVRRTRSARPFWGDVYGQDRRREMPSSERKARATWLSNSRPLSHCRASRFRLNCRRTKRANDRMRGNTSDLR